jgi:penicillin-binding protein 1A
MPSTSPSALRRVLSTARRRWYLAPLVMGALLLLTMAFLFLGTVPIPSPPQSTRVLAFNGQEIASLHGVEDRTIVPLTQISPFLRKAVVATEDRSFYHHSGVSFRGTMRALFTNVREGEVRQGGSTLTQQYVRNAFESVGRRRTVVRKIREAALALKLERSYSKDKILELYLNTVYFGRGAYGAEAAARTYFAKAARDLTLPEAAYIAGVIRAPELLQPDRSVEAATGVRNQVLDDMVASGDLTPAEAGATKALKLSVSLAPSGQTSSARAAFFVEYVRRLLRSEFHLTDAEILGGGLRVETTLDLKAQDAADRAVATTLDRADDPEVALVALDAKGNIRAMIGGRDFGNLERARGFNYAYQGMGQFGGRQAGSSFKPFVLASFVDEGYSVRSYFSGPSSIRIRSRQCRNSDGSDWDVSNFDHASFGYLDVPSATEHSVNTVYAQMIDKLTPQPVAEMAERVGGWDSIPRVCSIALGSSSVTPLQMARAYATFAGRGERPAPLAVTKIVGPGGKVVAQRSPHTEHVIDANVADTVNDVLRKVLIGGTAAGRGIGRPAAGKTGTTENHVDAWFVGYTPSMTAAVWMGFPPDASGKVPQMDRVRGRRVTGGTLPASIWQKFMVDSLKGTKADDFVNPHIGGKVIGHRPSPSPPPNPSPSSTCAEAFGFPINCSPVPSPTPKPTRPPLIPLPPLLPSLPIPGLLPSPSPPHFTFPPPRPPTPQPTFRVSSPQPTPWPNQPGQPNRPGQPHLS